MRYKYLHAALFLLLLLGTIRGGATTIAKYVSVSGVPPLGYAAWQSTIAAILLLSIRIDKTTDMSGLLRTWKVCLVCGVIGTALPNALMFYVVRQVPAGYMAVVLTTVPLLTYCMVLLLGMENIKLRRSAGIVIGFLGALLIMSPSFSQNFQFSHYSLLAFLAPAGYAAASVYLSRNPQAGSDPLLLAAGTQAVAALILIPASVISGQFHPIWDSPGLPEFLIVLHGIIAAIAYSLFFKIVHMAGPVFYSQSAYIIAVTGIAWGMLIFGEQHDEMFWFGTLLILGGLALVNMQQSQLRN